MFCIISDFNNEIQKQSTNYGTFSRDILKKYYIKTTTDLLANIIFAQLATSIRIMICINDAKNVVRSKIICKLFFLHNLTQ